MTVGDWSPDLYGRFRNLRLRPALDLIAQIPDEPIAGDIVDLGCGDGAVGPALRARFPERCVIGVDASPAMLKKADGYAECIQADIADWKPAVRPAVIFSNAALHWLPDHSTLLPRLAGLLLPGGVLAVQMPRQFGAPSHRFLRDLAQNMFPDRFDFRDWQPPVASSLVYWQLLEPAGKITIWETDYIQRLDPVSEGHPVRAFTGSTAMRPFLEKMNADEARAFIQAYDQVLMSAYPLLHDGAALMSFRRLFFVLEI